MSLPRKRSCPPSATARHPEGSGRAPPSRVRPGLARELPPREGRKASFEINTTRTRIRRAPATSNRGPVAGTTSNPAIEQGGCPGRGSRTRGEARVRPLNNYRHPKFPLTREHGASRLILRGVVLLGPFSLRFHCGQSSTECSRPCGDSRFLSYSL